MSYTGRILTFEVTYVMHGGRAGPNRGAVAPWFVVLGLKKAMDTPPSRARKHELKTWPKYFDALSSGDKTFEVRKDDRGFMRGDFLVLREWVPAEGDDD